MDFREANAFIGKEVQIAWLDRKGAEKCQTVRVYEVNFVPMYGPCLITDQGDIQLDRVVRCAAQIIAAA